MGPKTRKAPISQSAGAVSVPSNRKIAQVYVAKDSKNIAMICVNVTYRGSNKPLPRVSLWEVAGGIPSTRIGAFDGVANDLTLSDDVLFSMAIPQVAGRSYAIVVEYPSGQSGDTFEWKASATKDAIHPCFTFDGARWNQVNHLCEYVVYGSVSDTTGGTILQPMSKGPVGV